MHCKKHNSNLHLERHVLDRAAWKPAHLDVPHDVVQHMIANTTTSAEFNDTFCHTPQLMYKTRSTAGTLVSHCFDVLGLCNVRHLVILEQTYGI